MDSEYHQCIKCQHAFDSEAKLEAHKQKKVPCDFVCTCGKKFPNRYKYYRHQKDKCDVKRRTKKEPVFDYENNTVSIDGKELVPINDFVSHDVYTSLNQPKNYKVTMRETIVKEVIVEGPDLNRIKAILASLQPAAISSLKTLDDTSDINEVVFDVMGQVHADPAKPEHHTILLSDASRNSSRMYARNPVDDGCRWVVHPRDTALQMLKQHSSNVVSLLLDSAVDKLLNGTFLRNYTEKKEKGLAIRPEDRIACVYMNSRDEKDYVMILHFDEEFSVRKFDNVEVPLRAEYILVHDLFDCPDEFHSKISNLRSSIRTRKDEVLNELKHLMIDEKTLIKFLHSIEPKKLQTIKKL